MAAKTFDATAKPLYRLLNMHMSMVWQIPPADKPLTIIEDAQNPRNPPVQPSLPLPINCLCLRLSLHVELAAGGLHWPPEPEDTITTHMILAHSFLQIKAVFVACLR